MEDNKRGTFDKLVAGLSSQDRAGMLERINKTSAPVIQFTENDEPVPEKNLTLHIRFKQESVIYRIILWVRALFSKTDSEKLYNEDVLSVMARNVNKNHPGILNHRIQVLDSVFYEHLKSLKEAADFFKPYFSFIEDNSGDFYVFLSTFITPAISERINAIADPFTLDFETEPTNDVKNRLLKSLDEILNSLDSDEKSELYYSVSSINWLRQFSKLPFIHFASQFTNIAGNSYTCPYRSAQIDYESFAAIFTNVHPVQNEALEAVLLFSQKKEIGKNAQEKDIERTIKEFLSQANHHLATIQMFISSVPIYKVGKIINYNYDWLPGNIGGAEAWFPSFRSQWRKVIESRWNDWVRERKKNTLSASLKSDFKLDEFPSMLYKPWTSLWLKVPFACELTGGFLSWFCNDIYDDIIASLNEVMMEGVFVRNETRVEYSEGLNLFVQANSQMKELNYRLSPDGEYGKLFEEFSVSKVRNFQIQNQIDSMMTTTESEIHEVLEKFCRGIRMMEHTLKGLFDDDRDSAHDILSNFHSIKGHSNREWRDKLEENYHILTQSLFYITELEPIDAATSKS